MRSFFSVAAGSALFAAANADLCTSGAAQIMGNWYCQVVNAIQYSNFAGSGSYNRVTNMDPNTGSCSSEPFGYSGSLAPLNGEVSMHFRGPLQLKQFAFYSPGSSQAKRSPHAYHHRHHHHHHAHEEKRAVGDTVIATINGQVVSWINEWDGSGAAAPTPAPAAAPVAAPGGNVAAPADTGNVSGKPFVPDYTGDWIQAAYYNAESGTAKGVAFLNNMGGQGSGTFDYHFGNSLSYAASDAKSGAASPQILKDMTLPSNTEITIMSDKPCTAGSGCGYSRPDTVAHHGFGGDNKVFLMEFSMPMDGSTGFNADMPAVWMLNAEIPRTLQYGKAECSCWTSGCGEFDLFEVLDSGNTRCKSTVHGGVQGGDSDYFERPTGAPIKAAVVMSDDMATIKVLPSSFDFSRTLTNEQVRKLGSHKDGGLSEALGTSLFSLTSNP